MRACHPSAYLILQGILQLPVLGNSLSQGQGHLTVCSLQGWAPCEHVKSSIHTTGAADAPTFELLRCLRRLATVVLSWVFWMCQSFSALFLASCGRMHRVRLMMGLVISVAEVAGTHQHLLDLFLLDLERLSLFGEQIVRSWRSAVQ